MPQIFKNVGLIYLFVMNLFLFSMMYYDKQQAKQRKWRVSEFNLLFLGMIGGGIGGLLGQQLFHHKTKKFRFYFFFCVGSILTVVSGYFIITNK